MSETEKQNLLAARRKNAEREFESLATKITQVTLSQVEIWGKSVPIHVLEPESFDDPKSRQKFLLDRVIEKLIEWRDSSNE